jgi:hypothetical protein
VSKYSTDTTYVTADGTYGDGHILLFKGDMLTEEQWSVVDIIRDNDRYDYVKAVLEGDLETVAEFHEEYKVGEERE